MQEKDQIQTVGDMFRALEAEIRDVKAGNLPLDTARVVQRGRSLQLKAAELNLQFMRVTKAQRTGTREFNMLTGESMGKDMTSETKVI
jgi:hypothetical protein